MSLFGHLRVATRLSSWLRRSVVRSYRSATAVQVDDDCYHWLNDDDVKMNRRVMEESDGCRTLGRGVQWVIMGDPTVRRHVYAARLAKLLDVPHISVRSLVKQDLSPNSSLYKKIASAVNQGKLVPADVIFGLLSTRLEEGDCRGETGFILDGIPRSRMQAETLDQIAEIDLVLNLKCKDESATKESSASREFHSIATSRFTLTSESQTDHLQSLSEKLVMYAEQKKALEEYYKQQKKLVDFQVSGRHGDGWEGLLAALQLQHLRAVNCAANDEGITFFTHTT